MNGALYVDTSALAKLYIEEPGTAFMREHARAASLVASSVLVWPEALAMLSRRRREGLLTVEEYTSLHASFVADFSDLVVVDLDGRVLEIVDRLVAEHPLGGSDASHLASALFLQESGLAVTFACADCTLLSAARAERLQAFDPTTA